MESVRSYIYAIFIVSIISGVVNILSSGEGGSKSMQKNVKFICSLAVTAALLYPLKYAFSDFDFSVLLPDVASESTLDTSLAAAAIIDRSKKQICIELENAVKEEFNEEEVTVSLELDTSDTSNIIIETIYLKIGSHRDEAALYLEEISGCDVALMPEEDHG